LGEISIVKLLDFSGPATLQGKFPKLVVVQTNNARLICNKLICWEKALRAYIRCYK
jgi:hypothetical protein